MEHKEELVLDFAAALGERILVSGGELWRAEDALGRIFRAYQLGGVQICMLPHLLLVSAQGAAGPLIRQRVVGDTEVDLEELTRLNRLVYQVTRQRPEARELEGLLQAAVAPGAAYSFPQSLIGMNLALVSLVYLFGGGVWDAVFSVLGIVLINLLSRFLQERGDIQNKLARNALGTFAVGALSFWAARAGFGVDVYQVMIVVAFGLMPGVPLINAFRELLCGRVQAGSQLLAQVLVETLSIVAGYYLAISFFG